jgi:hypothetical protein
VGEHQSESDIANTFDVRNARFELVVDHDAPARIDFDANVDEVEGFDTVYGLRPTVTRITSAASLWTSG